MERRSRPSTPPLPSLVPPPDGPGHAPLLARQRPARPRGRPALAPASCRSRCPSAPEESCSKRPILSEKCPVSPRIARFSQAGNAQEDPPERRPILLQRLLVPSAAGKVLVKVLGQEAPRLGLVRRRWSVFCRQEGRDATGCARSCATWLGGRRGYLEVIEAQDTLHRKLRRLALSRIAHGPS
eukprot:scaffold878_cov271-Pinguiococcus_pyrenoidosus.AAC.29